jgi:hypothetical protein
VDDAVVEKQPRACAAILLLKIHVSLRGFSTDYNSSTVYCLLQYLPLMTYLASDCIHCSCPAG